MSETAYGILKIKVNEKEKKRNSFQREKGKCFFSFEDSPYFCTRSKGNRKDHSSP
jgi:hypothetical protein